MRGCPMFRRRTLLASAGASAILPAFTLTARAAPSFVAWHDRNGAQHKALLDENAAKGYRTSSLCIYGAANDPRYVSVMLKRPVVLAQEQIFGVSGATLPARLKAVLNPNAAIAKVARANQRTLRLAPRKPLRLRGR